MKNLRMFALPIAATIAAMVVGAPAYATTTAPVATQTTTAAGTTTNVTTESTTNVVGQSNGTVQKGANNQNCTQQNVGVVAAGQLCVQVNGNVFVNVTPPAECTGDSCAQAPATFTLPAGVAGELATTCAAAKRRVAIRARGAVMTGECTCNQGTVTVTRVAVASSDTEALAVTGTNTALIATTGGIVLLVGAGLFLAARRRRIRFTTEG